MASQKIPMTKKGEEQLREELQRLKSTDRPNVIQAISTAREHGDLRENAEYHAAKEQQAFLEGRIADLEYKLSMAHVIDISELASQDKVVFGATVALKNAKDNALTRYQIVGDDEADFKQGKISINSPIARALIGKVVGDYVEVQAPGGELEYEITKVEYI